MLRDLLIRAKARISTEETWAQDTFARTALGEPCSPTTPEAVEWCAAGAVLAETGVGGLRNPDYVQARNLLSECAGESVSWFNDHQSHEKVMKMFDCAIEKADA